MSQTILTLANPAPLTDGVGVSVAVPVSDDTKTFCVSGTFDADHAVLEVSNDNANWDTLVDQRGQNQAPVNVQFSATNARLRLIGYRSGTPVARLGVQTLAAAAIFNAVIAIAASGPAASTSVAGFGLKKTFVLNGGSTANADAIIVIEVSLDGGATFVGVGRMQGGVMTKAVPLIVDGIWTHVRANTIQGTVTGLNLAVCADPVSADLGQAITQPKFSGVHLGGAGVVNSFLADVGVDAPLPPATIKDVQQLKFSGRHAGGAGAASNPVADLGADAATTTLTNAPQYVTRAMTVQNLRVKPVVNTLAAAANVTVFKNGVATTITVVVGAGSTAIVSDLVHTVAFAAGDTLDVQADSNAGGAGNNLAFSATIEATVGPQALATAPQYVTGAALAQNLRVKPVANTLAQPANVTVFKNGVATALTVAVPAGSTAIVSDTTDQISFAAGDTFDIQVSSTAGGTGNELTLAVTFEFVPVQT